ncbi:flagellin N-terminal helical domain-containing protein [Pandoraea communis]|uniref:flagellin N-terminal helical domain-containing protein n=1 Tax=Pandoraea communis TaxID=2508297 RepID=UPI0025A5F23D|nr:flagellin [Pandoraea communis]MDM8354940.1 flagellin [Pandoraea communis]
MSSVINTNIFSLVAQRNLNTSQSSLQTSITRLSSGLRINSAADDAAGLAISDRMSAQINGLTQAQRNANDGISLVQTAAGALSSITDNLQRIRTLAVQSTNSTNSASDRAALDQEVQQRLAEINRLATQTKFNGLNVLDGSMGTANFQVGADAGQTISVNLNQGVQTANLGQVALSTGNVDLSTLFQVQVGTGDIKIMNDGTSATGTVAAGTYKSAADLATAINAAAASAGFTNGIAAVDSNGELQITNTSSVTANTLSITALNASAGLNLGGAAATANITSLANGASKTSFSVASSFSVTLANNDLQIAVNGASPKSVTAGTYTSAADLVNAIGRTVDGVSAYSDSNGYLNIVSASGFQLTGANGATTTALLAKLGTTNAAVSVSGSLASADVKSVGSATKMISQIDAAINTVDSLNATLGAIQNRFQSTISSLSTTTQNMTSARSGVQDTDYAAETANLTKSQILQQAGISMLAQANQLPQQVLKLLQ